MNILSLFKLIFQSMHATEFHKRNPEVLFIVKFMSSKLVKYVKLLLSRQLVENSGLLLNQMFFFYNASALFPLCCKRSVHRTKGNSTTKQTNNAVCLKTLNESCLIHHLNCTLGFILPIRTLQSVRRHSTIVVP